MAQPARMILTILVLLTTSPALFAQVFKEVARLEGHPGGVQCIAFSLDGKTLASACTAIEEMGRIHLADLRLWDVATARHRSTLRWQTDGSNSLAFSPDSKTLATGSPQGMIKLWDLTQEKDRATFKSGSHFIHRLAFSADGKKWAGVQP